MRDARWFVKQLECRVQRPTREIYREKKRARKERRRGNVTATERRGGYLNLESEMSGEARCREGQREDLPG